MTTESDALCAFKQWVRALDWTDLQNSLEFRVRNGSYNTGSAAATATTFSNGCNNCSRRDEYDMIHDMVRLQVPLPTPIHPRAIPYDPASKMGRNYVEATTTITATSHCNTTMKPRRWLRFVDNNTAIDESSEEKLWKKLQQQNQSGAHRSQRTANVSSARQRRKGKNVTDGFTSRNINSNGVHGNNNHYNYQSMDIVARQFRLDDGTVLTAGGGVEKEHHADTTILMGTVLQTDPGNTNGNPGHSGPDVICRFNTDRLVMTSKEHLLDVSSSSTCLDLLRYTSRGLFATKCPIHESPPMNRDDNNEEMTITYPPWFDPTNRWFPITMYLAARYEMSLWNAFYYWSYHRTFLRTVSYHPLPQSYECTTMITVVTQSLVVTIKTALQQEAQQLLSPESFHIRDMMIWNELERVITIEEQMRCNTFNLWVCPILELGTFNDTLREQVREQLQLVSTQRVMEELLLADGATGTISDETNTVSNMTKVRPSARNKARKRMKKPAKKEFSNRNSQDVGTTYQATDTNNDDKSTSSSDDATFRLGSRLLPSEQSKHGSIAHQCDSRFSTRQRSRHTVLAMSLIEDILIKVFDHVDGPSMEASPDQAIDDVAALLGNNCSIDSIENPSTLFAERSIERQPIRSDIKANTPVLNNEAQNIEHVSSECDVWDVKHDQIAPTQHRHDGDHFPQRLNHNFYSGDPSATIRTSNLQGFSSMEYNSFTPSLFQPPESLSDTNLAIQRYLSIDGWGRFQGIGRNESILTDYFHNQHNNHKLVASSTAASIASSDKGNEFDAALEVYDFDCEEVASEGIASDTANIVIEKHVVIEKSTPHMDVADPHGASFEDDKSRSDSEFNSPSPPSTPSPTLSPILVSLSELSDLPTEALELLQRQSSDLIPIPSFEPYDVDVLRSNSYTSEPVPKESVTPEAPIIKTSSSRENLKTNCRGGVSDRDASIDILAPSTKFVGTKLDRKFPVSVPLKCRDDHDIVDKATVRRSADALKSYRNIVMSRSEASKLEQENPVRELKKIPSYKTISAIKTSSVYPNQIESPGKSIGKFHFDFASSLERSRSDLDGNEDYQNIRDRSATRIFDTDLNTVTKDGATTISSGTSQRESDEVALLREQRNVYRDMCLTLGSEVAMLKNVLATQACTSFQPVLRMQSAYDFQPFPVADGFDHRVFHITPRAQTLAALSDAGYRGEYESLASEDEVAARMVSNENIVHLSSGLAVNASDHSRYDNNNSSAEQMNLRSQPLKGSHDPSSSNSMQSRLARDIFQFLEGNAVQLRQLDGKIQAAIERMNRLVKTVWPRAQVKLYGSHVTGLSVVSSDLDFVVCLPAVHKNDIAVAPGALEGRNAINESSQKLLARRLKGESWIDPRSMKLIDRTAVPVIKVSTKDTKKNTLHLDISFDGPGHHGLEAAQMISSIMNELPMLRPLVVVIKQFLIERSLLEAYTGGISSYGLSLMVARYLQEQSSGADVGSLLMGFLDFYGNHFDPRSTGISVRKRQYFARPNYYTSRHQGEAPMWGPNFAGSPPMVHIRRNSFSDKESTNIKSCRLSHLRHNPHHHTVPPPPPPPPPNSFQTAIPDERNSFDNGMPYTFDPLFVEDPLSSGNNVGRNSFRIFQVQRAFSDAHRALVAALEWEDIYSSSGTDASFSLLKCLLQSENVVYDL